MATTARAMMNLLRNEISNLEVAKTRPRPSRPSKAPVFPGLSRLLSWPSLMPSSHLWGWLRQLSSFPKLSVLTEGSRAILGIGFIIPVNGTGGQLYHADLLLQCMDADFKLFEGVQNKVDQIQSSTLEFCVGHERISEPTFCSRAARSSLTAFTCSVR